MAVVRVLSGHVSAATAHVDADYPYGFRLRCQRRMWIETDGKKRSKGQRVVTQTSNPKAAGLVWNKPKASTYSPIKVLYIDEDGYVQNDALHSYDRKAIDEFRARYADALTGSYERQTLAILERLYEKHKDDKWVVTETRYDGTPVEVTSPGPNKTAGRGRPVAYRCRACGRDHKRRPRTCAGCGAGDGGRNAAAGRGRSRAGGRSASEEPCPMRAGTPGATHLFRAGKCIYCGERGGTSRAPNRSTGARFGGIGQRRVTGRDALAPGDTRREIMEDVRRVRRTADDACPMRASTPGASHLYKGGTGKCVYCGERPPGSDRTAGRGRSIAAKSAVRDIQVVGEAIARRHRLITGVFPTGISYADRAREVGGDYRRLAFLSFRTLDLEWEKNVPADLRERIEASAGEIRARRGERFQVSTSGQTVMLGSG